MFSYCFEEAISDKLLVQRQGFSSFVIALIDL